MKLFLVISITILFLLCHVTNEKLKWTGSEMTSEWVIIMGPYFLHDAESDHAAQ